MTTAATTAAVRRWPRRAAIGVAVTGALLGGAYWFLGREATLQALANRIAAASGGTITITGVSGSLYGAMHFGHLEFRGPDSRIAAANIDIDWSPWQYLSSGVAISKLRVASVNMHTLREGEPAKMPATLKAPVTLSIADAHIATVTMTKAATLAAATVIKDVRFKLNGNDRGWELRDAGASTPWGQLAAAGRIGADKPFKLDAGASLTQTTPPAGQAPAFLKLRAGGDLVNTRVGASGQSGKAVGEAQLALAPFEPVPLRALDIKGSNIDPGFFNPALPTADLSITLGARIDAARNVSGKLNLVNQGPAGTLDQQRLPLRAMAGTLGGTLSALDIGGVLLDFGGAGRFTGSGRIARGAADKGLGAATFTLHTERFDLKGVHGSMRETKIAGDVTLENAGTVQTLRAKLADSGLRLDVLATLDNKVMTLREARIAAGKGILNASGEARLDGERAFQFKASASRFDPAAFGNYPKADINADLHAAGILSPAWKVAAGFALRPSRLFDQPLSGKGKFNADANRISGVDAALALGQNTAGFKGGFGAPGDKLLWKADGKQLSVLRGDLYGTVAANGVVTGTVAAPRTTFTVDARGLGWTKAARAGNAGVLAASGEAWLAKGGPEVKASGTAQRLNPAAFGAFLSGSINGGFSTAASLGAAWRASADVALKDSTLSNAPFWGHAKFAADARRVSGADVDLHIGPNILAAQGSFGAPADKLDWKIDAPQLAVLGPDFGGVLRGAGTLSGTMQTPSLAAALDGQNLKLLGRHQVKTLRASASLGAGRGPADPLVSDIEIGNYVSGETRVASARLQTGGTRAAHTLRFSARGDSFDAAAEANGGWSGNAWVGTIASLKNTGRYSVALQAPVPLRLGVAPGAGVMGLMKPEQIALSNAVLRLPDGSVSIASLDKDGARWRSKGSAGGVPLNYLAQFSEAMRDNVSGDLALGADWSLDMQAPAAAGAAPALAGTLHVFREKGDLIVGAEVPVVLGLKTLDLRADVNGGALRTRLDIDGVRTGRAQVDATATLLQGRVSNDSPLKLSANADMASIAWLAPLSGQPSLELDGALKLVLAGAGTVGNPTLNGSVAGDNLGVRWADQGIKLRNGVLRAQLAGDQLLLERLSFEGTQGRAQADGALRFSGGEATMNLKLVADKLEIMSRPDRTVVITGQSTLTRDARRFALEGKFRADRALVELAPQGRPTLSDDVIVLGRSGPGTAAKPAPTVPLTVDIEADLGDAFRLRGMGIDAELNGAVRVRANGGKAPRVNGSIRVASGTYKAYGQNLVIERGVLTFSGPYDNPALNILAVRKRPEGEQLSETNVEAGVQVRGTALAPAAKLVSTPSVPDSEKLSWLVLGHGMEGVTGNEAGVLGAAAGALLGGSGGGFQSRLANTLGVDELGLSQAKGLESTVVTVGKRISSRAYLSFEQGATTASSLVKLRYKLNPRVTLQFQTGTNTALDVLYSWAFD